MPRSLGRYPHDVRALALTLFLLTAGSSSGQDRPPGGPPAEERKLVKQFDRNGDGWLNREERAAAREMIRTEREKNPKPRRAPGPRENIPPGKPGPPIDPASVKPQPDAPLFDPGVLRTLFLKFESDDWEAELADFNDTDVDVPALLVVDGREYPDVGVHFRGASSYMMVPAGSKRSLNLALDFVHEEQRLGGQKTLNLLNSHGDPSMMSSLLTARLASGRLPAPKANFARVAINGECWGIYTSLQQYNQDFVQEHFKSRGGARWKVKGSPNGRSGLDFAGEDPATYRQRYQMKSGGDEDWKELIELCRRLSKTPIDGLEAALAGRLNVDGVLWFLALDIVTANSDGYWVRASDFSLYRDEKGMFHVFPHDMNECFHMNVGKGPPPGRRPPEGPPDAPPGKPKGERLSGPQLDPLVGMDDAIKPLRSRLLQVPAWRKTYLERVRLLAEELDWSRIGPFVAACRALIEKEVAQDTRKLSTTEQFLAETSDEAGRPAGLRAFCDQRRKFLLAHPEVRGFK